MRWVPELPPRRGEWTDTVLEWLIRSFRKISQWSEQIQREIANLSGIVTYGAQIAFNAGDGTPHGDLNATDFTGHPYADATVTTALFIESNHIVTFGHNAVAYLWTGPTDVTVGVGGSHTAVATDLTPVGTADHNILTNRTLADQHPTAAITGLDAKQASQDSNISNNTGLINTHKATNNQDHQITHDMLVGQSPEPDPHPQYQQKQPAMILGGTTDNFTLNTTDSKLVNYSLYGETNTSGQIDPINGEITVPAAGVYTITANVAGAQGNSTKEEWIEIRLDLNGMDRGSIAFLDVTTDKTTYRQLITVATRQFNAGDVLSLYMWASAGLGTFTVGGTSFEVSRVAEQGAIQGSE